MRRLPLLWPLLVGVVSLAATAWLWQHERQAQERSLRSQFEFELRQTAIRIEERLAAYEQVLRGVRGLFDAAGDVTGDEFLAYADAVHQGPDFIGLRAIAYAPLPADGARSAPLAYAAPALDPILPAPGADALADPALRAAMDQAAASRRIAITARLPVDAARRSAADAAYVLVMAVYREGQPREGLIERRTRLAGWVLASFRVGDLMSSLYGEDTPGLVTHVYDGVVLAPANRIYPPAAPATQAPRFQAQEFISIAGHAWTLSVRSSAPFEQRFRSDSPAIIVTAGGGLSLALALLTWQLVTARERADAAARTMTRQLRESSERYRRIVETANEGIWLVDADGLTTFVNPKLEQLLGRSEGELLGRRWTDAMNDDARAAMTGEALARLREGVAEQHEIGLRRGDGGTLWATVSTAPLLDARGRYAGALAMVTDIGERRLAEARRVQLENQLRESQKMQAIGTLAGGIAHDFNNIVAAILGNTELVRAQIGAEHPAARRVEQIVEAATRGRSLVQQIVTFSRRQAAQRSPVALGPLLDETVRLLRATVPTQVAIELSVADPSLQVLADATQLQQVLMNLCTNAWHAMNGGGGTIRIGLDAITLDAQTAARLGVAATGRHAHLWVADDGCGMDEATRERVFEPFFTTKPVGKGTGLGLPVVHGIVRAHGGAITVDSTVGRGTTFHVYLPLVAPASAVQAGAAPAPAPAPAAVDSPGRGEHVLYVDDDPVMVFMVQALLERAGYRVSAIGDPHEALRRAGDPGDAVDLVVTDFNMPELSGLALARELDRIRPGLPVILTSGFVDDSIRSDALRAGVRHVLQKEYTVEQLVATVHDVLQPRPPGPASG